MCSRTALIRLRRALYIGSAILVGLLSAACETPRLERDTVYPADWPGFGEVGEDCSGLEGTYANRGRYVDDTGMAGDAWLTDVLAAMPTPREAKDLAALHVCERVTLRLESMPLPASDAFDLMWRRLVAVPSRRIGDRPDQWAPCDVVIQLPRGLGYPHVSGDVPTYEAGAGACLGRPKWFRYINHNPAGMGYVLPLVLEITQGTDGSLIVQITNGFSTTKAWARFPRVP